MKKYYVARRVFSVIPYLILSGTQLYFFRNFPSVLKQRPAVFIRLPTGCGINFDTVIK
jgi:hypothetical protein